MAIGADASAQLNTFWRRRGWLVSIEGNRAYLSLPGRVAYADAKPDLAGRRAYQRGNHSARRPAGATTIAGRRRGDILATNLLPEAEDHAGRAVVAVSIARAKCTLTCSTYRHADLHRL